MCGRFYIGPEGGSWMREMMQEIEKRPDCRAVLPGFHTGEIFPGSVSPVITRGGSRLMQWGWAENKTTVINARSETVLEKPLFRHALLTRRCLAPADGYYEWKRTSSGAKTKQKYVFFLPRPPLLMAGLWREEGDSPAFVILTRDAPPGLAEIHGRMPVILSPELRRDWLAGGDPVKIMGQATVNPSFRPVERGTSV